MLWDHVGTQKNRLKKTVFWAPKTYAENYG